MSICACIGPVNGEPHCMCDMIAKGLKTKAEYDLTPEQKIELREFLSKTFGWHDLSNTKITVL